MGGEPRVLWLTPKNFKQLQIRPHFMRIRELTHYSSRTDCEFTQNSQIRKLVAGAESLPNELCELVLEIREIVYTYRKSCIEIETIKTPIWLKYSHNISH